MKWSNYNHLFTSDKFGYFLYNALSNRLVELNQDYYDLLSRIKNDIAGFHHCNDAEFKTFIKDNKIVVEQGEEEKQLLMRQYRRHAQCYNNTGLGLTICPTTACNFRCPYCFEMNGDSPSKMMDSKTMNQVVPFVKRFAHIKSLSVTWFGGEPTLVFDKIEHMTDELKSLDVEFTHASLITNGYLLDQSKIAKLNGLNIQHVQITIDGSEEVHDQRRVLANGGKTFQTIINNIQTLAHSDFKGKCSVRVNLDKGNYHAYPDFRSWFKAKFPQENIKIYSHYVFDSPIESYDHGCELDMPEWSEYTLKMYKNHKIPPRYGLHPIHTNYGTCVATHRNGYVIGPEGELFKCWNDVGQKDKIVGNIHADGIITNPELVAMYSEGIDPHQDTECRQCFYLPICSGGCVRNRLHSKYFNEGQPACSRYKSHLIPFLEAYYDLFLTREICNFYLEGKGDLSCKNGYRVIRMLRETKADESQTPNT